MPDEHSRFDGWSGACSGTGTCDPKGEKVTARFVATHFPLELKTSGEGTMTMDGVTTPPGTHWLPVDSTITLTATPAPGWLFIRWQASCVKPASGNSCELLLNHAQPAIAIFEQGVEVTAAVDGPGTVVGLPPIGQCTSRCSALVPRGAIISLGAVAADGGSFSGWSPACGAATTCRVTATQNTTVTARFHPNITLLPGGDGEGVIGGVPGCSTLPCSAQWLPGRTLRLEAVAQQGSRFIRFEGCPASDGGLCSVAQYTPQVRAVFDRVTRSVIVGEAAEVRGGFLVSSPETEFVWMEAVGPMTFGGVQEQNPGPVAGVDSRWVLFQTRPPPIREVLNLGNRAFVRSADRQVDGGIVFLARATTTMTLGPQTLQPDEEAIVSLNASGGVEWVYVNPGPASDLLTMKTNRVSGQSYFVGGLRAEAAPVTIGSTTIEAPLDGGSRYYLGSLDRQGSVEWLLPRFHRTEHVDTWQLVALNQGPALFDVTKTTYVESSCVPPYPAPGHDVDTYSLFSRDAGCLYGAISSRFRNQPEPKVLGGTDEYGEVAIVGWNRWIASGPFGVQNAFYARFPSFARRPEAFALDTTACYVEPHSLSAFAGSYLMSGNGRCPPMTPFSLEAPGVWFSVFDRRTATTIRGSVIRFLTFLGAEPLDDREARLLVRTTGPANINGVIYPAHRHLLLLTVRP